MAHCHKRGPNGLSDPSEHARPRFLYKASGSLQSIGTALVSQAIDRVYGLLNDPTITWLDDPIPFPQAGAVAQSFGSTRRLRAPINVRGQSAGNTVKRPVCGVHPSLVGVCPSVVCALADARPTDVTSSLRRNPKTRNAGAGFPFRIICRRSDGL